MGRRHVGCAPQAAAPGGHQAAERRQPTGGQAPRRAAPRSGGCARAAPIAPDDRGRGRSGLVAQRDDGRGGDPPPRTSGPRPLQRTDRRRLRDRGSPALPSECMTAHRPLLWGCLTRRASRQRPASQHRARPAVPARDVRGSSACALALGARGVLVGRPGGASRPAAVAHRAAHLRAWPDAAVRLPTPGQARQPAMRLGWSAAIVLSIPFSPPPSARAGASGTNQSRDT